MSIKTTINIKKSHYAIIKSVALQFNVSISFIINSLANKAMEKKYYKTKLMQQIKYQDRLSDDNDSWYRLHVSFKVDVYEKCFDFKKLFKFSTSFFISSAFNDFFKELINELENGNVSDNYPANYVQLYTKKGYYNQITLIWDMPEQKTLQKLKKLHT